VSAPVVGFAGMSHLGIVSLAAAAAKGFAAVGFDRDASLVARLRKHELPVSEPGLEQLFAANAGRVRFTSSADELAACDLVYIAADVPTDDEATSDLAPIRALIDRVARHLGRHSVLIVLSQVPPGFTRAIAAVPAARLIYQVETLVFGRAVERALEPERFIVGCAAPEKPLPAAYRAYLDAYGCPILPMRYESAELAKTAINICLVASVSVANTLAELSAAVGADWSEIAPALRLDRRIGQYSYLTPGLGISGGNLERDLRTIGDAATANAADASVIEAFINHSRHAKDWCWRQIEPALATNPSARVAVLGLAYKENTHSTKNSPSLALLAHLEGKDLRVHDPVVPGAIVPFATWCASPLEAAKDADIVVLATPWPEYRALEPADLARAMRGRVLIDPYRLLDGKRAVAAGFEYRALGLPLMRPD
jgi:UDPglucose 6-dehydrogenase